MAEKEKRSIDATVQEMLEVASKEGVSTPFSRSEITKPCPIGQQGACCKQCFMGPCRLVGKTTTGLCGATLSTVTARNLCRAIAGGASSHSDHGRNMCLTLIAVGEGKAPDFQIKDEVKLRKIADYLGVPTEGKTLAQIAVEVGKVGLDQFGQQEGEMLTLKRATPKRQALWRKLGIAPRGVDREIVELMHRTHMGTDQDAEHLLLQGLRASLTDGWGGAMLATDISDALFGTLAPVAAQSNFGVLKQDEVNIIINGHEPTTAEMLIAAAASKEMLDYAKSRGANGINLAGVCCSGNEILVRHGVPVVGNFLQQELVIATGAVEAMVVDYQCIMQGIQEASKHFHTKIITTSPKVKITGAQHIEFNDEHGLEIAKQIIRLAADNFPNRKKVHIPNVVDRAVVGFSHEYLAYMQGGLYRESFRPLNDAIIAGRIRGAAGVVGCNNIQTCHDEAHINIVKELIKNDVVVVTTGCDAIACAKWGLLTPEVMEMAGPGLREVCQTIGVPPVLHMGSCVDNSRILTVLTQMATEGGLGEDIDDLPAVGIAPEWMSEKALAIGAYFVASGAYVMFGVLSPISASAEVIKEVGEGWQKKVGGRLEFVPDWKQIVEKSLAHIDAKRKALKLVEYDPKKFARSAAYVPGDAFSSSAYEQGLYSVKAAK